MPEDRSHDGFVGAFTVRENLVLDLYRSDEFSQRASLKLDAIEQNADARIEEFDIRTESTETPVASLSGGNQQKVVVARELSRPLKVLIASQPTRGVDVGSIEFIHKRIVASATSGTAVIIVSTELDEIFALSDRIAVMYDGRIVGIVGPDIAREQIGLMMAGAPTSPAGDRLTRPRHRRRPRSRTEPSSRAPRPTARPDAWLPSVKVTLAAVVLALVIGAFLIVVSDHDVIESLKYFFSYP